MLRLVLDTNVVLDLLHWNDPAARPLAAALDARNACALTDARCFEELRLVLRLSRFDLAEQRQNEIAQRYRERCAWIETPPHPARSLPRCKDADDQKFLELACAGGADLLVTKDKALLKLARRRQALGPIAIVTPQGAAQRLALA